MIIRKGSKVILYHQEVTVNYDMMFKPLSEDGSYYSGVGMFETVKVINGKPKYYKEGKPIKVKKENVTYG